MALGLPRPKRTTQASACTSSTTPSPKMGWDTSSPGTNEQPAMRAPTQRTYRVYGCPRLGQPGCGTYDIPSPAPFLAHVPRRPVAYPPGPSTIAAIVSSLDAVSVTVFQRAPGDAVRGNKPAIPQVRGLPPSC